MEPIGGNEVPCESYGLKRVGIEAQDYELEGELQRTMEEGAPPPPVTQSSFTALLELPPSQAMELLHNAAAGESPPGNVLNRHRISHQIQYTNGGAALRGGIGIGKDSPEGSPPPSNFSAGALKVKTEPTDNPNSSQQALDPALLNQNDKTAKRKDREKKGKGSSNKCKTVCKDFPEDVEKLPYVHVRARRGQATDSHSLAERARRGKINARMKLLQELVPGCNKISGTALLLDEIINHVQSLQRQVEYLSMRLSAANQKVDLNLDSLLAGNGTLLDSKYQSIAVPATWPDIQMNRDKQESHQQWHVQSPTQPIWIREEDHHSLITPESSLLSYGSPHSASLHSSQLKMEMQN